MDDIGSIIPMQAMAYLDMYSLMINWKWNKFRLPDQGAAARNAIKAMNILQVRLCHVVSLVNVSF